MSHWILFIKLICNKIKYLILSSVQLLNQPSEQAKSRCHCNMLYKLRSIVAWVILKIKYVNWLWSVNKTNLFPSFPQQRENTITSAPSLMVLVLKPFPSKKVQSRWNIRNLFLYRNFLKMPSWCQNSVIWIMFFLKIYVSHCPIVFAWLLFTEYPRDMHCRILSGSIPPPLSANIKKQREFSVSIKMNCHLSANIKKQKREISVSIKNELPKC